MRLIIGRYQIQVLVGPPSYLTFQVVTKSRDADFHRDLPIFVLMAELSRNLVTDILIVAHQHIWGVEATFSRKTRIYLYTWVPDAQISCH